MTPSIEVTPPEGVVEVYRSHWRPACEERAFVLHATGIPSQSAWNGRDWSLYVGAGQEPQRLLAVVGAPLAGMAAVYTGYLFAQAKARDLWQSPLLPPHLLVQAFVAGSAALLPLAAWLDDDAGVRQWSRLRAELGQAHHHRIGPPRQRPPALRARACSVARARPRVD